MTETILLEADTLVEETTNSEEYTKIPRWELVELLRMRDGDICMHPDCGKPLDIEADAEDRMATTIDHWIPQTYGKANGWSMGQIWDLDNLKLMHKKCNAHKGDLLPNEDGTLPEKKTRTWKNRRAKRVNRPDVCTACNAGRNLEINEFCRACGSGPQPARMPRTMQRSPKDCDHQDFICVACNVWNPELRKGATMALIAGSESSE